MSIADLFEQELEGEYENYEAYSEKVGAVADYLADEIYHCKRSFRKRPAASAEIGEA